MMDEMAWLRMFGGGFGSGVDLAAVIAFVAFGIVSFLSPKLGYKPERAGGVTISLFLLIGYVGASLFQLALMWMLLLDGGNRGAGRDGLGVHIPMAFALLKLTLFLMAMLMFAIGVSSYRMPVVKDDAE